LGDLLDYVALGTVADCVSLGESEINRAVVNAGLHYIKARRRPCWDVAATYLTRAERDISSEWLAFQLAPRLNARGRIDHSMLGFEFLWTDSRTDAETAFKQLDADNQRRRTLEHKMVETAKPLARRSRVAGLPVICVVLHDGHAGVQGIVASRLVEAEGVPALVLTPGTAQGTLTGSMRSIADVDAKRILDDVAIAAPGAMLKYGGHTGACGLTLWESELSAFTQALQQVFSNRYPSHPIAPRFITDGTVLVEDLSLERVHELESLGPFGRGFDAPVFDGVFEVLSARIVGSDGTHLSLELSLEGTQVRGIWFAAQPTGHPAAACPGDWLQCVFALSINTYRGLELSVTVRHGEVITQGAVHG
jgi:single-stranded-DNA-specific exonuclease